MLFTSKSELIEHLNQGFEVDYLFFWGHQTKHLDSLTKACLSQWYPSNFVVNDIKYATAEHYMMAQKAKLFQDEASFFKILLTHSPKEAKLIGKQISHFDESIWLEHRYTIVKAGTKAKFTQNPQLQEFLLSTKEKVLVEASPTDLIWGIGMTEHDADCRSPTKWKGLNLLGFALMQIRDEI